jgi:hypothetical protein
MNRTDTQVPFSFQGRQMRWNELVGFADAITFLASGLQRELF